MPFVLCCQSSFYCSEEGAWLASNLRGLYRRHLPAASRQLSKSCYPAWMLFGCYLLLHEVLKFTNEVGIPGNSLFQDCEGLQDPKHDGLPSHPPFFE
jgi:hypothetical protein